MPEITKKKKFVLIITHSTDNHDRANAAVALAVSQLIEDADLAIFYIFQGAHLAKKGVAETIEGRNFAPVRDLFPTLIEEKDIYSFSTSYRTAYRAIHFY